MSDFSLTTLFVVPVGQTTFPNATKTEDLTAGQVGIFNNAYVSSSTTVAASPYFYAAQGRTNNYLQGSKRSDKISGRLSGSGANQGQSNVTSWYKVVGSNTIVPQITRVGGWNVKCGDTVTLTLRAFSSYINTLYFNGFTRSVTVQAPCCDCGADPCDTVDVPALIDQIIAKLQEHAPGTNPDNIGFNTFWTFARTAPDGSTAAGDDTDVLSITGKPLTVYAQPCDVAANPQEYDRMSFDTFVYSGPATTADFIVPDNCNIVATATIAQNSNYPKGSSVEIAQMEKNYYSYQAVYLKHLYRMGGFNENFESFVNAGTTYDTFYIKFNEYDKAAYQWGAYVPTDSTVIIAVPTGTASTNLQTILATALGTPTIY